MAKERTEWIVQNIASLTGVTVFVPLRPRSGVMVEKAQRASRSALNLHMAGLFASNNDI